nr:ribosomal protein S3-domain protein [uncultured archaeon]
MLKKTIGGLHVKQFLFKELERAGVSSIEIQKTPIATRISIAVRRPAVVVGKRGNSIRDLCDILEKQYSIENPQIEVVQVAEPELDAKIVAEKIAHRIENKPRVKPIMRIALKEIMEAGALGAEIRVAGKVVGKGGKAKTLTVRKGYLKKSGEALKIVRSGKATARLSAGAIGISVHIVTADMVFPGENKKKFPTKAQVEATAAAALIVKHEPVLAAAHIPKEVIEDVKEEKEIVELEAKEEAAEA